MASAAAILLAAAAGADGAGTFLLASHPKERGKCHYDHRDDCICHYFNPFGIGRNIAQRTARSRTIAMAVHTPNVPEMTSAPS